MKQNAGMTNIASIFKSEITRLARKEVRTETESLRKASTNHRSEIAALKKQLRELQTEVRRIAKGASSKQQPSKEQAPRTFKFSASMLKAHRQKLGLTASEFGLLVGASQLSIYKWEGERAVPQERFHPGIAAVLAMRKQEAQAKLESLQA